MTTEKFILTDTFNGRQISTHRTIEAAQAACNRHSRMVERTCGSGSFVRYSITSSTGRDIYEELAAALWPS